MLRTLFVISILGAAAAPAFAAVGDPCTGPTKDTAGNITDVGFGDHCDTASGHLQFCDTTGSTANPPTGTVKDEDCTFPPAAGGAPLAPNGKCEAIQCTDSPGTGGCAEFHLAGQDTCDSGDGDQCLGISPLLNTDPADDNQTGGILCQNGEGCVLGATGETCSNAIPTCTAFGATCVGNILSVCFLGGSEDSNPQNGTLDPGEDLNGNGAIDGFLLPQPLGIDCASAFTTAGTCNAAATSGPLHSIIQATQALADCDIPQPAGEGEGEGAGGGEGEGSAHCEQDSQCGRGKVCDNGTCKDDTSGGQTAPSCSDSGAGAGLPLAGLAALIAVAPMFRRRRA